MKPSFSTTSSVGMLLAFVLAAGAMRSFSCIGCEVTASYRAAVRTYDKARAWGLIARWWLDPEFAPAVRGSLSPAKPNDVCEMRPDQH
jgi:hypothetical protein